MIVHATANEILPRLWVGPDYACKDALDLGLVTLCVATKPCENKGCDHIPLTEETPIGVVTGLIPGALEDAVIWVLDHWVELVDGPAPEVDFSGILVHCNAGMERSPLVIATFLREYLNLTMDDAYAWLKKHRPVVQDRQSWLKKGM